MVLSVVLSPYEPFSLLTSLVRCIFLLLLLFFFPCVEFRIVRDVLGWGSVSSSGSSRSVGLRIEGRSTEEFESG